MNINKRPLLLVLALLLIQTSVFGQGGFQRNRTQDMDLEEMAEMRTKRMATQLNLNEEQQKLIKEHNLEFVTAMKEKMDEMSQADRAEMRKEMNAFRETWDNKLQQILTSEQWKKWKELSQMNQRNGRNNSGG